MKRHLIFSISLVLSLISCKKEKQNEMDQNESNIAYQTANHQINTGEAPYTEQPIWSNDASIYEVNIRQFSEEGTLNAVTEQLERIKNMGIEIVWLMPVHPISKERRKQSEDDLGSYYAVGDFRAINPEYGTMDDMDKLIQRAHALDLKILLDWVPNHTGWDHPWITDHPEYYTQDSLGNIIDPINPDTGESWGWTDVADLNYDNSEMRQAMIADMSFWIKKGIDGFRCDVAHGVPADFWRDCVAQLKEVGGKNIFMLAEAEKPELAGIFNMSYAWTFHHTLLKVLHQEEPKSALKNSIDTFHKNFGSNHYAMMFTTNHDENSWAGTEQERYGKAQEAMAVLTFTIDGMPLVYSGQESGLNKRLDFFTKDAIDWNGYPKQTFYTKLLDLKHKNKALWNGDFGGSLEVLPTDGDDAVYIFERVKDNNRVLVAVNFSNRSAQFAMPMENDGSWLQEMGVIDIKDGQGVLPPNGYVVWVKNK